MSKKINLLLQERKKILLGIIIVLVIVVVFLILKSFNQNKPLSNSPTAVNTPVEIVPSQTLKEYTDPSGFTLSYPDNLSIVKNDIADNSTYTDLQLTAKGVNGSLVLKITDSTFKTLDEWTKLNKEAAVEAPKEVKLGSLKGVEIKTPDRLLLGALDNGVFFNIEVPLIEKDFWTKVYNKVLTGFSFAAPEVATSQTTGGVGPEEVSFEGEEVIE